MTFEKVCKNIELEELEIMLTDITNKPWKNNVGYINYCNENNLNCDELSSYYTYTTINKKNIGERAHKKLIKKACKNNTKIYYDSNSGRNIFMNCGKLSTKRGSSKRIDGEFNINGIGIFFGKLIKKAIIYQKTQKNIGGTQDNAFKDLELFIQDCPTLSTNNNTILGIICADGEYYTSDKINQLKILSKNKNCIITNTNELCKTIKNITVI